MLTYKANWPFQLEREVTYFLTGFFLPDSGLGNRLMAVSLMDVPTNTVRLKLVPTSYFWLEFVILDRQLTGDDNDTWNLKCQIG